MNCWYESEAIGRMPCKARTLGFAPEIYFWLSSYRGTLKCGAVMMMKSLGPGHSKSIWPAITDSREENIKTLTKYQAKARRLMVSASFWVEKTFDKTVNKLMRAREYKYKRKKQVFALRFILIMNGIFLIVWSFFLPFPPVAFNYFF